MRAPRDRRDDEPAFVLHTYAYRETSVIVEALTATYGRVALVARGVRRPRSELRGVLQAFQPLMLSWTGGGELKTLVKADWCGGLPLVGVGQQRGRTRLSNLRCTAHRRFGIEDELHVHRRMPEIAC